MSINGLILINSGSVYTYTVTPWQGQLSSNIIHNGYPTTLYMDNVKIMGVNKTVDSVTVNGTAHQEWTQNSTTFVSIKFIFSILDIIYLSTSGSTRKFYKVGDWTVNQFGHISGRKIKFGLITQWCKKAKKKQKSKNAKSNNSLSYSSIFNKLYNPYIQDRHR